MLNAAEVALILRRTPTWFLRHRAALEAVHGFPPAVDGLGMRWSSRAVLAWVDRQAPAAPAQTSGEDVLLARAMAMRAG